MARLAAAMAMLAAGVAALAGEPAQPGPAQAVQPQNVPPDELPTHLIKVLRTTNKAQTNRYVPKVYDLKNVNPYDVFRWVRRTAEIEEGAFYFFGKPETPGDRDSVKSGKVVVVVPDYMIPGVDKMMQTVDVPEMTSAAGDFFLYFRPKHRSVQDAGFVSVVNGLRGSTGTTLADNEVNMLLVYAAPSRTDDVQKYLPLFDVRPPQVMIEATVYEITVDNESKLGLDYISWKNGPGRNLFAAGYFAEREHVWEQTSGSALLDTGTGGTYGLPGHGFRASGSNAAWFLDVPSAFFDYLVVKGKARVMTSAKLATRNLVAASLTAGDTILYYETRVGSSPNAGYRAGVVVDTNSTDPKFPDNRTVVGGQAARVLTGALAGLKLDIQPIIGQDMIDLAITVSLVSHTGFDDKGVPQLVARTASSIVQAKDGQELILGGYSREVFVQRADKMPILGSLPLLGYLFGGDGSTTERRRVVLVLTPHVIQDASAMAYEGTKIDAMLIKDKATRQAPTKVPATPAGFDQWLLDPGK